MKQSFKSALSIGTGMVVATGFVLAPAIASADTKTASTTINANVGSTISITTSGTVALPITPTGSGSASSKADTVTVNTNNATGYTLQLANTSATVGTLGNGTDTLAAASGTFAAPAALGNNSWGYHVDGLPGFTGTASEETNVTSLTGLWAKVPLSASPDQIKSTSSTATNDVTTVWYGAMADTTKSNGIYTGSVTYTATTKP